MEYFLLLLSINLWKVKYFFLTNKQNNNNRTFAALEGFIFDNRLLKQVKLKKVNIANKIIKYYYEKEKKSYCLFLLINFEIFYGKILVSFIQLEVL